MSLTLFAILAGTAALSAVLTWTMRELALRRRLLDLPTARSSHSHPTPRLGGVAIATSALAAIALLSSESGYESWQPFMIGGLMAVATGLADDLFDLAPAAKLAGEMAALLPMSIVAAPLLTVGPAWLGAAVLVVAAAGYMNLFNFMDGSDGLAAGVAVINAVVVALLAGAGQWSSVSLILGAAALGFLLWNHPPASVFMGDAGSLFLGYGFAITGAMVVGSGVSPWAVAIALTPMLGDGGLTLVLRVARGERVWEAHRSHLYQRLLLVSWSHGEVGALYWSWAGATGALAVAFRYFPGWPQPVMVMTAIASVALVFLLVRDAEARTPRHAAEVPPDRRHG